MIPPRHPLAVCRLVSGWYNKVNYSGCVWLLVCRTRGCQQALGAVARHCHDRLKALGALGSVRSVRASRPHCVRTLQCFCRAPSPTAPRPFDPPGSGWVGGSGAGFATGTHGLSISPARGGGFFVNQLPRGRSIRGIVCRLLGRDGRRTPGWPNRCPHRSADRFRRVIVGERIEACECCGLVLERRSTRIEVDPSAMTTSATEPQAGGIR